MFLCYSSQSKPVVNSRYLIFHFYFQLESILLLGSNMQDLSEYYYYLIDTNYFFISPPMINEKIDLIDLHSLDNLYAKNKDGIITPFYKYICYK